ncbi:MAG: hypothetical protein IPN76_21150 [Saprospiraceae bacterium]|nr:hypothetical protein [Saprospiraceae bacterium]
MPEIQNTIEILPEDRLLRRVQFLDPNFIKEDGSPASSSFTLKRLENGDLEEGLSTDIEKLTAYPTAIQDDSRFRLYALVTEFIQSLGLQCEHDPLPENHAHALIKGNISRSIARKLAQQAIKIDYPE